jgi:hypothetical protein
MQKLAGLITENQIKQVNENQNDFNTIEKIISQTPYPVTDLESLYDEMETTDLVDSVADAMGGDFTKARKALEAYGNSKFGNQMSGGSLNQEIYMDFLNELFNVLGNKANSYDDRTWTNQENELVKNIYSAIERAGIEIA